MAQEMPTNNSYTDRVVYLDGSDLQRPQTIQGRGSVIVVALLVAAALFGAVFAFNFGKNVVFASNIAAAEIESLTKDASLDSQPALVSLMPLSAEERTAALTSSSNTLATIPNAQRDSTQLNMVRLNKLVPEEQLVSFYQKTGSGFSAVDSVKILKDSWNIVMDKEDKSVMKLKYADFTSKTMDTAIATAMTKQGFESSSITDSGKDDMGNTYKEGKVATTSAEYTWRISAIPLSDAFSIKGLPSNAYYLGIKVTKTA